MAIVRYLAMTGAEFCSCTQYPPHIGWLACHFSPSGVGLSNIPKVLPAGSLLIVDDSLPFIDHDPELICDQLQQAIGKFGLSAAVLDFQRGHNPHLQSLTALLQSKLPCPVFAPPDYVQSGAVFLPPCPLHTPVDRYLKPYQGRQILLDTTPFSEIIHVTQHRADYQAISPLPFEGNYHWDYRLYCHYEIATDGNCVSFTLQRNRESFNEWSAYVESLGVIAMIGLDQEWK